MYIVLPEYSQKICLTESKFIIDTCLRVIMCGYIESFPFSRGEGGGGFDGYLCLPWARGIFLVIV